MNKLLSKEVSARSVYSSFLDRPVRIDLIDFESDKNHLDRGLLIINDGQHLKELVYGDKVQGMVNDGMIIPFTIVAIHANEKLRVHEYGISNRPDYLGRGELAGNYENFVIGELLPWLNSEKNFNYLPSFTAFAGCSLGGLSALDIVTSNPGYFSIAGVFSGSLWWRSKGYENGYTDKDRIIFQKIENAVLSPAFNCWLMAGTDDERNDRNQNGIIDSVEDTLDMYELLNTKVPGNVSFSIVNGGKHDFDTWSRLFPEFLLAYFCNPVI